MELSLISEKIQAGRAKEVKALVQQALDEGIDPNRILNEGLMAGMAVIGERFKNGEAFVPEVLVAARAMNKGAEILKPVLAAAGVKSSGKACIGTVKGDLHDVGKNLVTMMLESKGLEVIDLGTDVPPEKFVEAARDQNCKLVCCSALLTTTMPVMRDVVEAFKAAGLRDKVRIMVGGAPITDAYCKEIGADMYTPDAASCSDGAVELIKEVSTQPEPPAAVSQPEGGDARPMTKRDIVLRTLAHKESDVIPYFLDLTDEKLRDMIKFTGDKDFFLHSESYLAQERNESFTDLGDGKFKDMFGVVWDKGAQEGDFGIATGFPLPEANFDNGYQFPEPDEKLIREKCERLVAQKDKFTMYIIGFSLYERLWALHGIPETLMDFIEEPEFIEQALAKIVEYNCKVVDIVAEYPVDCIFFGDDWGQQRGLIMGYPIWKKFIYPCLKKMYDHVKKYGKFVAQHSCGDCVQVFPDLVELGLDIYNTFQPEVYDIVECKRRFGDKLTFFGGISTQCILPFKTPDEVKAEMYRVMDILGKDGGYILAPTHAMPNDIPPENVLAFLDVAKNENPR